MKSAIKYLGFALSFLLYVIACVSSFAGEVREEFDSPKLDPNLWEITTAGDASHEIKDGKLNLISDGVQDGVFLYYKRKIGNEDITFEVIPF